MRKNSKLQNKPLLRSGVCNAPVKRQSVKRLYKLSIMFKMTEQFSNLQKWNGYFLRNDMKEFICSHPQALKLISTITYSTFVTASIKSLARSDRTVEVKQNVVSSSVIRWNMAQLSVGMNNAFSYFGNHRPTSREMRVAKKNL